METTKFIQIDGNEIEITRTQRDIAKAIRELAKPYHIMSVSYEGFSTEANYGAGRRHNNFTRTELMKLGNPKYTSNNLLIPLSEIHMPFSEPEGTLGFLLLSQYGYHQFQKPRKIAEEILPKEKVQKEFQHYIGPSYVSTCNMRNGGFGYSSRTRNRYTSSQSWGLPTEICLYRPQLEEMFGTETKLDLDVVMGRKK